MGLLLLLIALFLVARSLIVGICNVFISEDNIDELNEKEPNITIHNYYTENHLHISKEDLKSLSDTNK